MSESKLQDFLAQQARKGRYHSEGRFSLDPVKAMKRLSSGSWLSPYHYLLKFVQLANRYRAESIEIEVARTHTTIFLSLDPELATGISPRSAYELLRGETSVQGRESHELLSGLLGCLQASSTGFCWQDWNGERSSQLKVVDKQNVGLSSSNEAGSSRRGLSLTVNHKREWNLLKIPKRILDCENLLLENCLYSPVKIVFNDHLLCPPTTAALNAHLTDFGGSRFNPGTGVFEQSPLPVAASCILYDLAVGSGPSLAILNPPFTEYRTVHDRLNVWVRALSPTNTLRPNGRSVPAWMLQYRRKGENIGLQGRPERELCRAVLAMNLHAAGNLEPLRLFVVRHGVLISKGEPLEQEFEIDAFRGCTLVWADEELNTDLSGLALRRDEALKTRLQQAADLLAAGEEYFEKCAKFLTLV